MISLTFSACSQLLTHIKNIPHKLNWSKIKIYEFDQKPNEFVRERFKNFIETCVEINIVPAKFYISCKRLFHVENIQESLSVLYEQALTDIPSWFAYLVFQTIYMPFMTEITARQMS